MVSDSVGQSSATTPSAVILPWFSRPGSDSLPRCPGRAPLDRGPPHISVTALPVQCYTYSHGLFYPLDCALPEDASALLIPTSPVSAQSGLNKPWPAAWMVLSIGQLGLLLQITLT